MATTKTRKRKLERDRYERKLVRQAQRQRRKRQVQAGIGAFLAMAVIGLGVAWLGGVFESETDPFADDQLDRCNWLPREPAEHPERVEVGTPPANPPTDGTATVAIDLDAGAAGAGQVAAELDVAADPCGVASMSHLAGQGFFDDTTCHALVQEVALQCGDPSGTGLGGPSYGFYGENLPPPAPTPPAGGQDAAAQVPYPAGTVALADTAGENSSQFLIFYADHAPEAATYPVLGTVTSGLEVVQQIGEAGGTDGDPATPAEEVRIRTLTVSEAEAPVR